MKTSITACFVSGSNVYVYTDGEIFIKKVFQIFGKRKNELKQKDCYALL